MNDGNSFSYRFHPNLRSQIKSLSEPLGEVGDDVAVENGAQGYNLSKISLNTIVQSRIPNE